MVNLNVEKTRLICGEFICGENGINLWSKVLVVVFIFFLWSDPLKMQVKINCSPRQFNRKLTLVIKLHFCLRLATTVLGLLTNESAYALQNTVSHHRSCTLGIHLELTVETIEEGGHHVEVEGYFEDSKK